MRAFIFGFILLFASAAFAQVQLIPRDDLAAMLDTLPDMDDSTILPVGDLQKIISDPSTMWYTRAEMPPAYQLGAGNLGNQSPLRFADPMLNVSRDGGGTEDSKPDGLGGNANVDFPWGMAPGGTMRAVNVRDFKAMWLPKQPSGEPWPVVYFGHTYQGLFNERDRTAGVDWTFPVGTVFIEVLVQRYGGVDYPFEIRLRRRDRISWDTDVLRPFASRQALIDRLTSYDASQTAQQIASQLRAMPTPQPEPYRMTFEGERNGRQDDLLVFSAVASLDVLPPMPEKLTHELLTKTQFVSVHGGDWNPANKSEPFSIVPPLYDGAFAGTNEQSCNSCHEHCTEPARHFDRLRGWYGLIRGSRDKIFSWHPIEPAAFVGAVRGRTLTNHPATDQIPYTVQGQRRTFPLYLRPEFVSAGVVAKYEPQKHPVGRYQLLTEPASP